MTQIKGIDVSHHNANIDWKKVAADGVKFAFIKASEGYTFVDSKFKTNVEGANAAGIKTGAYHYAKFGNIAEALTEAKHFLSVIASVNLTYPVVLDLEEDKKKAGKKVLTDAAVAFLNMVKGAGHTVLLYSGKSFLENNLEEVRLKDFPFWVARYNTVLGRSADIWQYSSSGKVAGITGNVDMNWAYRDFAEKQVNPPIKETIEQPMVKQPEKILIDDVTGNWAEPSILKAKKKKAMSGYEDGSFKPNQPVTRAQLAAILDRIGLLD